MDEMVGWSCSWDGKLGQAFGHLWCAVTDKLSSASLDSFSYNQVLIDNLTLESLILM